VVLQEQAEHPALQVQVELAVLQEHQVQAELAVLMVFQVELFISLTNQ
jgi:hypothetical protein